MARFVAIYDACVLYPAPLRDFLLRLARTGLFHARWTRRIQDEWVKSLIKNRPDLDNGRLERTCKLMEDSVPDCLVEGYESLTSNLVLPDPNDCHVLAAAIRCHASVIVTTNLKDFPPSALDIYDIEAQHPDHFVQNLLELNINAVCASFRKQRESLRKKKLSPKELLDKLRAEGLTGTATQLEEMIDLL